MRRLFVTFGFVVLGVCLFPARADAFFWDWLDDLSGPHFKGFLVELQVSCQSDDVVLELRRTLQDALEKYRSASQAASDGSPEKDFFDKAVAEAVPAVDFAMKASARLAEKPPRDAAPLVREAVARGNAASAQFKLGLRAAGARYRPSDGKVAAAEPTSDAREDSPVRTTGAGIALSFCDSQPFQRVRSSWNVSVGWGYDSKPADRDDHNRMVTLGASYHQVATAYLSYGAGAGVAIFSSTRVDNFQKLYVEPYIVDFRPFALRRDSALRGPWWHVLYFRYNGLIFPTGFEPGRFGRRSPRYGAELIHSIGIHADLDPAVRKWRKKW